MVRPVRNTKVAAAMLTVGVPFAVQKDPIANVYSEGKPYRPGMPGDVIYMMADSGARGEPTVMLAEAYGDNSFGAALELDGLVDELCVEQPELGERLKKLLARALMQYMRGAHENRDRIGQLWKFAPPMVLVKKSDQSWTLIHKDVSEGTRRRMGVAS